MKKTNITILLVVGILILVNLVSDQYYFRLDLTEDNQYTLSRATEDILESLDEPVNVKAYFSEELPPNVAKTRKDFEEFLIEFKRLSGDNVVYEFIDPNKDEKVEQEALQAGIQPVMINVREKDQMKQQKAFLGAVLELGEQKEVIPFMQPQAPLEYVLSTAIKKMSVIDKPAVGIIQGHGEASIDEMSQVEAGLNVLYNVENWNLQDSVPVPDRFKTIAMINTVDTIPPAQFQILDRFLERGGNLFIAMNRVNGDLNTASGNEVNNGLESWLARKGLTVDPNFIIDASCGAVTVQQQQGMFRFASNVEFPYIPIISTFADHPVTKGLEAVILQFASPIRFTGDSTVKFSPLAFTSENSGSLKAPQFFNVQRRWTQNDFPLQKQVVAAAIEKKTTGGQSWRIVVIGDGNFPISGKRDRAQQIHPDNVNLMVNAIDWLSDDTGLIELRTKGIQFRPIDELEDGTKVILKWVNFILPVVLLILYGLLRMQLNRNKRIKRMEESYE